jgi:hypothetical protein
MWQTKLADHVIHQIELVEGQDKQGMRSEISINRISASCRIELVEGQYKKGMRFEISITRISVSRQIELVEG